MKKTLLVYSILLIVFMFVACSKAVDIPEFSFYEEVELADGGAYADIVIDTFDKNVSEQDIKDLVTAIINENKLKSLTLYSTYEAYKANFSQSYRDLYPDALENGLIVSYNNGNFTFPED